ncbi:MAG: nucleotidyltransferase domain-containing protein [Pseudomonadota bacterium]
MNDAVSPGMFDVIRDRLRDIADEEDVRILLAVESGSRAWGFHSPDSDYDVRFIYARPLDWHFRLDKRRDVIERPIDDELDLSGWELSKALCLAVGSNAVIAEWLQSPIRYLADDQAVEELRGFAKRALDRKAVTWHYLSLLRRQQARLRGPDGGVRIKRYFYVLRPALALRWMRLNDAAMPPMDMPELRAGCDLDALTSEALKTLTAKKMVVQERAEVMVAEPILDALVADEVASAERWLAESGRTDPRDLWGEANALHQKFSLG